MPTRPARVNRVNLLNSGAYFAPAHGTRTRKKAALFVALTWKGDAAPVTGTHGPVIKLVAVTSVPLGQLKVSQPPL
jgi:hypothetical protein